MNEIDKINLELKYDIEQEHQMSEFKQELLDNIQIKHMKDLWKKVDVSFPLKNHNVSFRIDTLNTQKLMKKYNQDSIGEVLFRLILKDIDVNCFVCGHPVKQYNDLICHHIDYNKTSVIEDGLTVPVHKNCHPQAWQFNSRGVQALNSPNKKFNHRAYINQF